MSDNVTGYGVPLTTAERVRRHGARTSPTVRGKLPEFELDESLEATYRETVLLGYEDIDAKAKKTLSDASSWVLLQVLGGALIALMVVLLATSTIALIGGFAWSAVGAIVVAIGFPYRRHELGKHTKLVEEAEEYLKSHLASGKARLI